MPFERGSIFIVKGCVVLFPFAVSFTAPTWSPVTLPARIDWDKMPELPGPDEAGQDEEPPAFSSEREAFEWHYRRHPRFGDRVALSQVAKEIGERVDLQWGTARTYALQVTAADAMSEALDATRELDGERA